MKNIEYVEFLLHYVAGIGCVENVFLLSRKESILESVQNIYGKEPFKC